ncbi:hypothetical protein LTR09_010605 [Extremus antarcticus]|uniref:Uncharacterized protein n=1 Tax=Extremus antarcticus TaxID=702011 RepID=A0AAJ0D7I0_9PEZI|nr:hypothetical protein LTR09_010605 [Extremus antarcticus]
MEKGKQRQSYANASNDRQPTDERSDYDGSDTTDILDEIHERASSMPADSSDILQEVSELMTSSMIRSPASGSEYDEVWKGIPKLNTSAPTIRPTKRSSSVKAAKDQRKAQSALELELLDARRNLEGPEIDPHASGVLVPGVTQTSPTHFIVRPGLSNLDFRSWSKKLPKAQRTDVLSAYLRYEHERLCERMGKLEDQYDGLLTSKLILTKDWDDRLQATSTIATAVCLHNGTWFENHLWLLTETKDGRATTWASLVEALDDVMSHMLAALTRVVVRARQLRNSTAEEAELLQQSAATILPARLREVRDDAGTSKARAGAEAYKRKLERSRRQLSLEAGAETLKSPPSPLRQERGTSPDTTEQAEAAGPKTSSKRADAGAARQEHYTFESESGADVVDMSLVVERLALNELKPGQ